MIHAQGDAAYVWKQGLREKSSMRRIETAAYWRSSGPAGWCAWPGPRRLRTAEPV